MKSSRYAAVFLITISFFTGCAFTKATLDVGVTPSAVGRGPLSSVAPVTVKLGDLSDQRPDTARIGYKRNGFGQKTADVVTARPVAEIVRDALTAEFAANGHRTGDIAEVLVSGEITTFWFDVQVNMASFEFMGTVAATLALSDIKTGQVLVTRAYQGHHTEKSSGGLEGTWQRVMNTALERMVSDVARDPRLLAALRTRTATTSAGREE